MIKIPLEIPQSVTEEETKEEFSFHSFGEILLALVLGVVVLVAVIKLPFGLGPNLIIGSVFFVAVFEGYRHISKNYYKWQLFKKSFHNVSFFDSRMDSFFNIKDIKDNVIMFRDNTMMSVIKVQPIDGSLLGDEEMKAAIDAFGAALKSIPHTSYIFSHSVEPNLSEFFDSTDEKIINQGGDYEEKLKKNRIKQKWLLEKMKETDARDRLNYFAVLYKKKTISLSFSDSISYMVGSKKEHEIGKPDSEAKITRINREVNIIIHNAAKQLEKTGVKAEVLNDDELMNLYSSYFLNIHGVGKSNLSPFMWLEE